MKNFLNQFENYLDAEKNLSRDSITSYIRDVENFFSYINPQEKNDILQVNKTTIMAYNNYLATSGKAKSTVLRNLSSLKSFYTFLDKKRLIPYNPSDTIKMPKLDKKNPKILSFEEVRKIINQPDVNSVIGNRDKIMLELLYSTGIRVSELISLDVSDFNNELSYIKCNSKNKSRIIPIKNSLRDLIMDYILYFRSKLLKNDEEALFLNFYGNRISRQGLWKIIKGYCKKANIDSSVTPNTFRHSLATHLIQSGVDLNSVKEILGHSDISTTQMYLKSEKNETKF